MIPVDANLRLHAYQPRSDQYEASKAWLESTLSGAELVRFAWLTLWAFLRISTNPRAFERPLTTSEAEAAVAAWLSQPQAGILEPGDRHWDILQGLMRKGQTVGPLIMDAVLASIAIEHGATLHTTDRDFSRFPGLKWMNPLTPR
ncbi:MAG: type II toxin-antitoxin system VapC family toxin [Nitrospira sp.]|nr:type II toxin-antitoxin system VapC family toxin [Nitrospira sp.]